MKYFKINSILIFLLIIIFPGLISGQDKLVVLSPNGGEQFYRNNDMNILWETSNTLKETEVVIILYKKGIKFFTINRSTANTGNYIWHIPADITPGKEFRIRIRTKKNLSINDFSDMDFEIRKEEQ